jgi:hypothetical protein
VLEQRIGRVHRLGQTRPIEVYNLVCEQGIEARIAGLVNDKKALFMGLFDGASEEVQFERAGSFLSRVQKLVEPAVAGDATNVRNEDADLDEPEEVEEEESAVNQANDVPPVETVAPSVTHEAAMVAADSVPPPVAPPSMHGVRELLTQVRVTTTPDGGISFTASREAAASLAALFTGFAQQLSGTPPP